MFSGTAIQARIATRSGQRHLAAAGDDAEAPIRGRQLHHVAVVGRDHRGPGRALRVGVLPLRLEAVPRRWRRLDRVLQRLVVEPPPRLLVSVLVGGLVDGGDERVGEPVVEARPCCRSTGARCSR